MVNIIKNHVDKGDKLYIEGAVQTRKWSKDGKDNYITEIVLQGYSSILKTLSAKSSVDGQVDKHTTDKGNAFAKDLDDEIPFS